jgi:biotin carboxylase
MPIFDDPRRMHESVLIQEFAAGTEYAIDIVSKDGEHKVAALWRYDKRPANGASFVYFATEVIDADTEVGKLVCEYVKNALDALDIKWGQTHSEVILGKEPRLVEVNCRQHNMVSA